MKWKAICPNCNAKQKRWDFFDPFTGFANTCPQCGSFYKNARKNNFAENVVGIFLGVLLIFIQTYLDSWMVAFFLLTLMLAGFFYLRPYFTRLVALPERDRTIYRAYFVPFVRFQILILALVLLLAFLSIFAIPLLKGLETHYRSWGPEIEKIESTEGLKSAARTQNETLLETVEMLILVFKNNLFFSFCISLLLLCNCLFFVKVRSTSRIKSKT